jgi:cystathionine beta-synthase
VEIHDDIVSTVGDTPLVRLSRIHPPGTLVAKLEFLNPGGSGKDRIALAMIERAEQNGWLQPGGTIVEPTSGNTGVALAMAAALRGYKLIAVMADKQSKDKQDLLRALGADVVVCPSDVPPDDPRSYYSVAERIAADTGAYRPDQYSNPANPEAQYATTGEEVWRQTDGLVEVFVSGIGTGGTITGVGRYLKDKNPEVLVVGVDPEGSIYTASSPEGVRPYLIEGVGEDFWPQTFDRDVVDRYEVVSDDEAFAMARRMASQEGMLVGGSGGMAVAGALRVAVESPGRLVVVLIPDTGRNYVSKVFNDDWMRAQGLL